MTNAHKTIQENHHHHIVITTTGINILKGSTQDCTCWSASHTIILVKSLDGLDYQITFPLLLTICKEYSSF